MVQPDQQGGVPALATSVDSAPVVPPTEAPSLQTPFPQELLEAGVTPDMARMIGGIDPADPRVAMFLQVAATMLSRHVEGTVRRELADRDHDANTSLFASAVAVRSIVVPAPAEKAAPEPAPVTVEAPDNRTKLEKAFDAVIKAPHRLVVRRQHGTEIILGDPKKVGERVFDDQVVQSVNISEQVVRGLGNNKHEVVSFSMVQPPEHGPGQYMPMKEFLGEGVDPAIADSHVVLFQYAALTHEAAGTYAVLQAAVPYEAAKVISDAMGSEARGSNGQHPQVVRQLVVRHIAARLKGLEPGSDAYKRVELVRGHLAWLWNVCFESGTVVKASNNPDLGQPSGDLLKSKKNFAVNFPGART